MWWLDLGTPQWECVHFGTAGRGREFVEKARQARLFVAQASLAGVSEERGLFARLAEALPFPATFVATWDGLHDGLGDLRGMIGAPGLALLLTDCRPLWTSAPELTGPLLELWLSAAYRWSLDRSPAHTAPGRPFHLFVQW